MWGRVMKEVVADFGYLRLKTFALRVILNFTSVLSVDV